MQSRDVLVSMAVCFRLFQDLTAAADKAWPMLFAFAKDWDEGVVTRASLEEAFNQMKPDIPHVIRESEAVLKFHQDVLQPSLDVADTILTLAEHTANSFIDTSLEMSGKHATINDTVSAARSLCLLFEPLLLACGSLSLSLVLVR